MRAQVGRPSLASLARELPIPSDAPPDSLRCHSRHSLATLASCHSAPPPLRKPHLGAPYGRRQDGACCISGALRFKRLQAAYRPPAHCLSATALNIRFVWLNKGGALTRPKSRASLARFARSGAPNSLRCPSATRGRSGAQASAYTRSPYALSVGLCPSLAAYGLQVARVSRSLGRASLPQCFLYVWWLPCALWGSRFTRGPPPRSAGQMACLSADAASALQRPDGAQRPTGANRP